MMKKTVMMKPETKTKILPSKPPKNRFPKEAVFDILTII